MPDWTYLTLHFLHTLALALWIGGTVALGALAAPVVFRLSSSRDVAGEIMTRTLQRFDGVLMACVVLLVVTSAAMIARYGRLSPWYAIEYVCIAMMSASAVYGVAVLSPRLRRLRRDGRTDDDEFEQLHRTSELSMQFNLVCATVALLFS